MHGSFVRSFLSMAVSAIIMSRKLALPTIWCGLEASTALTRDLAVSSAVVAWFWGCEMVLRNEIQGCV